MVLKKDIFDGIDYVFLLNKPIVLGFVVPLINANIATILYLAGYSCDVLLLTVLLFYIQDSCRALSSVEVGTPAEVSGKDYLGNDST